VQFWNVESYKIAEHIVRKKIPLLDSGAENPGETCQNQLKLREQARIVRASNEAAAVPDVRNKWKPPKYVIVAAAIVCLAVIGVAAAVVIEDRRDEAIAAEISRSQSDLQELGAQIAAIKDADLVSMNDFIAAYAQVEPLEREYDQKLQKFTELYRTANDRDSHRSLIDLQRLRGRHHPESWEKMSQIIALVRQINEITKREILVVHAMSSLPEPERARFWHEQFMPLAAQEHALSEELQRVGQEPPPDRSIQ
jgi:anti-sigma-K factor RskA